MREQDLHCTGCHQTIDKCDCPLAYILCKRKGHHACSKACPLRQDYVAALASRPTPPGVALHNQLPCPMDPAAQSPTVPVAPLTTSTKAKTKPQKPKVALPITMVPKPDDAQQELAMSVLALLCCVDLSMNSFQCGLLNSAEHTFCTISLCDTTLFTPLNQQQPSPYLQQQLEASAQKI